MVLKRFLLLVLLLDRAAVSDKLPASAPLLFKEDGLCKTSNQVADVPVVFGACQHVALHNFSMIYMHPSGPCVP